MHMRNLEHAVDAYLAEAGGLWLQAYAGVSP
jgi:hypothetical protein